MTHPGGHHSQPSLDTSPPVQVFDDEYYHQLCHFAGVGIIATTEKREICCWNSMAALIFGASSESMMGQPVASILPVEQRDEVIELIDLAIDQGEINEFELVHHDNTGQPQHLTITISPITRHSGKRLGVSFFIRDITRRRELENRFAQTERMASLGTLAGGVAHHFNNILGGIVTSVDYAIESGDPLTARRTLKLTADAIARAVRLVTNLLAFAEGDHRDNDQADLTETVCLFLDSIEKNLQKEKIELDFNLNTKHVWPVPYHQMLTVLSNLTNNARDAMTGGGQLTVAIKENDDCVTIKIQDTGTGIDETVLQHAFEPFFSTKLDPLTDIPRVGLGLAVVHGIVTDLGGHIAIRPRSAGGSSVEVTLPRAAAPEP